MLAIVLLGLMLAVIPFALPIAGWVSARRTRRSVQALERLVLRQADEIERLGARMRALEDGPSAAAGAVREAGGREELLRDEPVPDETVPQGAEASADVPELEPTELEPPAIPGPEPAPALAPANAAPIDAPPPAVPRPPAPPFDWESLIGVKLFAAIAGIALVLAAVFFLRYSIDQGWLQPPVRVAIGVGVALALLALCELKSAREYPATANALDGAAVAILFATFFAAHALWNLVPVAPTFVLLAGVTALAVVLSIRRESLFVAVLGLMGGFATPALLSAGENRPIPLFGYLLILNIGLAWVAYRQIWPVLTWLTLGLTTVYQWVWVLRFLDESSLSLAMGIFLVFPLTAAVALTLAGPRPGAGEGSAGGGQFEQAALISAGVPLLFAAHLASAPAYGAHASLLLGFLLLIDAGLLAIALARRQPLLHAAAGIATLLVLAVWLSTSYVPGAGWPAALGFAAAFPAFFVAAPVAARLVRRPFEGRAARLIVLAPLVLFVFPVLAAIEPAFARPLPLFATLLAVQLLLAWRAVAESTGAVFFAAALFGVAAQAVWSASYLTAGRLREAAAVYIAFGLVSMAAPALARRAGRAFRPAWGSGAVLLASLLLLTFVSLGPVTPEALWALALLLAVMNAGLFIESAAGGLPRLSQAGSLLSWVLLGLWWLRSAGAVGVVPSLMVLTGLTLLTLAGHAWASRWATGGIAGATPVVASLREGLYLGVVGHLFLIFIAANRDWSVPPWPLFGALAVMTLGTSLTSLVTRTPSLHGAGVVGAALVTASWAGVAGSPAWGLTAVVAAAAVSAFALAWMRLAGGTGVLAAAVALFVGELSVLSASDSGARPPFAAELAIHVADLGAILALTARERWRFVAIGAVAPAWLAVLLRQQMPPPEWRPLLVLSGALYALFVAYPFALGSRARHSRDPYTAAVLASAMVFFAWRQGVDAAGLGWAIGIVPVGVAAVLALLLRSLLALEPEGQRDLGRLALVAGATLAFATVTVPLQLEHQWITIGWALEGAALAWLYRRVPHRGLFYTSAVLLTVVFVRLALNPEILLYEPRGPMRILNWYLYTYLACAASMFAAASWMTGTDDRLGRDLPRVSALLPGAGVILLFLLLNIEIADYYATGPTIVFLFGTTLSQDLTYTIGWLAFGMALLAAGIYMDSRRARVAAVALIAVTTLKCFLYDLASLEGLYRVGSFVGLALSLALVSVALKKYVLSRPKAA